MDRGAWQATVHGFAKSRLHSLGLQRVGHHWGLSLLISIYRFLEFFICIAAPSLVFCPAISVSGSQTWLSFSNLIFLFPSIQRYSYAVCGGIALVPWPRTTSKQKVSLIKELYSIISSIGGTMSKNVSSFCCCSFCCCLPWKGELAIVNLSWPEVILNNFWEIMEIESFQNERWWKYLYFISGVYRCPRNDTLLNFNLHANIFA